jgi:hypothetical protein
MTKGSHRVRQQRAPSGVALAFLALALQVLLPFLVAYEIGVLGNPASAETTIICTASGSHAVPNQQSGADQPDHAGPCSLCIALAAAHAFTAAAPGTLPLPHRVARITLQAAVSHRTFAFPAASYHSRAPPFIG